MREQRNETIDEDEALRMYNEKSSCVRNIAHSTHYAWSFKVDA